MDSHGNGRLNAVNHAIKKYFNLDYALDVYEEESNYFYMDRSDYIIDDDVLARLLSFNNVIVTSHQAFFTQEAMANIANTTLQNIRDFRTGSELQNEVKTEF